MKRNDFFLKSQYDDLKISVLVIEEEQVPFRGVLQLVHGMCEYKERYIPFMKFMASHGYVCVIHDHRGHGKSLKSKSDRGYFYSGGYDAMIEDALMVRDWIDTVAAYAGLPVVLFGHSMGSLVVRSMIKRADDRYRALAVCGSPSYNPLSVLGIALARLLTLFYGDHYRSSLIHNLSFGGFKCKARQKNLEKTAEREVRGLTSQMKTANSWICSDPSVVIAYNLDRNCHFRFTLNGFIHLFRLMRYTYDRRHWKLSNLQLPVFFASGEDDACMESRSKFEQSVNFMRRMGYQNVTSKLYPDMRHEILNEIGKEGPYRDFLNFFNQYIPL